MKKPEQAEKQPRREKQDEKKELVESKTRAGHLFPLNGARRFRSDVVNDAIDTLDLVNNPYRYPF